MPNDQLPRRLPPREPTPYDNAIHGRPDYDDRLYDGEPDENVAARTRILDAIATATPGVKRAFIRELGGTRASGAGNRDRGPGQAPAPDAVPTIWHHGGMAYSVEGGNPDPVVVSREQHYILQAFAQTATAMGRQALESRAGIGNAPCALKQLAMRDAGRFRAAVRRPGKKGGAGYYARVQPLPRPQA